MAEICPLPALRQMGPQCQRHHANQHLALGPSLRFHASLFQPLLSLEIQTGSCREAMGGSGALWWTCAPITTLSPSSASHSKTLVCTDLGHKPARCLPPLPLSTEIHSWVGVWILHCHPGYSTFTTQAHTLVAGASLEQVSGRGGSLSLHGFGQVPSNGCPTEAEAAQLQKAGRGFGEPQFQVSSMHQETPREEETRV